MAPEPKNGDASFPISVVIVNYNGRDFLPELLASLRRQSQPADEILLVDNASTDGSAALVRKAFPEVRVLELDRNFGFAGGVNSGWKAARGEWVALINSDCTAAAEWLENLARAVKGDASVAAVVPKILRSSDGRIEQAGAEFNQLGHCWTRGFGETDSAAWNDEREVAVLTGCSVLLRRSALGGEDPLDASFFMYYEELDLSLRLREKGLRIVYAPAARCTHRGMASVREVARDAALFQQFYCNRNRLKIVFRYFPWGIILRNFPLLAASVAYWDWRLLRTGGIALAFRAVRDQLRFAAAGIAARSRTGRRRPWLQWMTRQTLGRMMAVARQRSEA